jgi:PleD family two-component response regulator
MQRTRECLIIDDDQDDQEIFIMCVRKLSKDINCRTMDDGVEAIATLMADDDYTPDYIFIDVNMPKMNGLECLKVIKNIKRLSNSKIFMYSTTSAGSTFAESIREGANDFIIKPAKTAELKERLSKIFELVSEIDK